MTTSPRSSFLLPIFARLTPAWLALAAGLSFGVVFSTPTIAADLTPAAGEQMFDRIVAVVNQSVITQRQLNDRLQQVSSQINIQALSPSDFKQLEERVLDRMITEEVELQRAKQIG
ncbi:SurA N-terminal domain-containing protein, partial [Halothiobacillus sp.]